jgi:glutamate dehydrogenase/leucine dehydrogenase
MNIDCDVIISNSPQPLKFADSDAYKTKCFIEARHTSLNEVTETQLFNKKIMVLPDILIQCSNAIASHAEHSGMSRELGFSLIESKIKAITKKVVERSLESGTSIRRTAIDTASERLMEAMEK